MTKKMALYILPYLIRLLKVFISSLIFKILNDLIKSVIESNSNKEKKKINI